MRWTFIGAIYRTAASTPHGYFRGLLPVRAGLLGIGLEHEQMNGERNIKRCVIVGGADIERYDRIRAHLREDDFYICCDSGSKHREALGIVPNLIVGDFDPHEDPHWDIETIALPREKDDTDTVFAVKEALKRGFQDFLLVGVIGGRLDHTLGNTSLLLMLDAQGRSRYYHPKREISSVQCGDHL